MGHHRALPDEANVHAAVLWRVGNWPPEAVEAGTAALVRLVERSTAIDTRSSVTAAVLDRLGSMQPVSDRRAPWTAFLALLTLWAENSGEEGMFWRAGTQLLVACGNASRGSRPRQVDALNEILEENLRRHPAATARELFSHCAGLASFRHVVVDTDPEADSLTYQASADSESLSIVSFRAFEVRLSRLRKRITARPSRSCEGNFQPATSQQHVAVRFGS